MSSIRARVACRHRGLYTVFIEGEPRLVRLAGRLRHAEQHPAVGDWVTVADGVIEEIEPRRGVLARADPHSGRNDVLAANVDVAFIVTSPNRDLSIRRLERFAALASGCETVALLNKSDLVDEIGPALGTVRAAVGGVMPVVVCSAQTGEGLDVIRSWLKPGVTVALLGTSGVGKSTLANVLLGADIQATAPIRAVDDRGRHTTVRRELFELPGGALLIDTPGLKLPRMSADADVSFDELDALAVDCRFSDCTHDAEPGCAVQAAIAAGTLDPARLDAMRALEREQRWASERESAAGRAAREARWRAIHKEQRKTPPRWEQ